jgi:hypothetical protein
VALALLVALVEAQDLRAEEYPLGRWTPGGYVEAYVVGKTESSPDQRPSGVIDLNLSGDLGRNFRLYLEGTSIFGGTPVDPSGGGLIDPRFAFQNLSPGVELQEAYADVFLEKLDLRLGWQKFAWGRLDTFNPTDVINPRRYTDPFILRESDLKVGVPALRASYYFDSLPFADSPSATAIWIPVPVSFRFPLQQERWFSPAANVPPTLEIPPAFINPVLPGTTVTTQLDTENDPAPWTLENGAAALRLGGTSGGADWSLVYYDGPETVPAFDFTTSVISPSAQEKIANGETPDAGDLTQLAATAVLRPRFGRMRLVGGDVAFSAGGFTARGELAFGWDRLVPRSTSQLLSLDNIASAVRPDLAEIIAGLLRGESVPIDLGPLFERRDVFEWGFGVDYPWEGFVPVLQINQSVVLDNDVELLVPDIDTRLLAAVRRSFLDERLATELVGVQGFERSYTTLQLRATYSFTDNFWVRAGYLFIAGTSNSVIGEYKRNDEVFVQARLSF